jgi:hypothetical protein
MNLTLGASGSALRTAHPSASVTAAPHRKRTSRIARILFLLLTVAGLTMAATGPASATSYQGYSGDFVSGNLFCSPGSGTMTLFTPDRIQIAGDRPNILFEEQNVWVTTMLFKYTSSGWQEASNWSPWIFSHVTDAMSFNTWYDTGSWDLTTSTSWTGLQPGAYYATQSWMYFGERPGLVGAGWASSTSYDSLLPYCQA